MLGWLLPIEKLPPWLADVLALVAGLAVMAIPPIRASSVFEGSLLVVMGLGISAAALTSDRRRRGWQAALHILRRHDPLLQWPAGAGALSGHVLMGLGDARLQPTASNPTLACQHVSHIIVFADCVHDGHAYRCDLSSLARALRASGHFRVRRARTTERSPAVTAASALHIRPVPWPRCLLKLELTEEERAAIEERRTR